MEKYRLISVGDSLTQGFQSFAVFDRGQKHSFPNQIVNGNPEAFLPFKTASVPYPGYPFNIEHFLNQLQEWTTAGSSWTTRLKLAQGVMEDVSAYSRPHPRPLRRHHNLAVHGYTTRDVFETTFRKRASSLHRLLLRDHEFIGPPKNFDPFESFNFAKTTHRVLCGKPEDVDQSPIDIACAILREEWKKGRQCLVTYWAGNNDVLGALVSGDKRYINEPTIVLGYIKKALEKLLEHPNARIVFATLPELAFTPFLNGATGAPLFPVYETIPKETRREIGRALEQINAGIRNIFRSLDSDRLGLVEMDSLFRELARNGREVRLDGKNLCLTTDFIELDERSRLKNGGLLSLDGIHPTSTAYALISNAFIERFRALGVDLDEVDVSAMAAADTLLISPPALIPQYLDVSSDLRGLAARINLFPFIKGLILNQFDFKIRDSRAPSEAV